MSSQCPEKKLQTQMTYQEIRGMITHYQDLEKAVMGHLDEVEEVQEEVVGIDGLDLEELDFQHEDE
jgi:hypothetical protein